jgi:hypothetical protein
MAALPVAPLSDCSAPSDFTEWTGAAKLRHTKDIAIRENKDPKLALRMLSCDCARQRTDAGESSILNSSYDCRCVCFIDKQVCRSV